MDIGNSHVIDYYLYHAVHDHNKGIPERWLRQISPSDIYDFDIKTEQRDGWTYDDR